HRLDPALSAGPGRVDGVLGPEHRVVVGEGHALATQRFSPDGDLLGRGPLAQRLDLLGLGDRPVLAELTPQVAARRAEGQDARAGVEVVQRLLLDRVDAEPRPLAVSGQDHPAVRVLADEAEPPVAVLERAGARAEVADDAAVVLAMPPTAEP